MGSLHRISGRYAAFKGYLKQVSESYRKIRNTIRFLMANTADFDLKNALSYDELLPVDRYMYIKLKRFVRQIKNNYDHFDFGEVYRNVNSYLTNTLSSFYLDFTKDILYIEHPSSKNVFRRKRFFMRFCCRCFSC